MESNKEMPQIDQNEEEEDASIQSEHSSNENNPSKSEIQPELPKPVDDFIIPSENDDYHEHILNLLKIKNNPNLNKYFYDSVGKIKKSLLIGIDLSIQDEKTKKAEEELVPPALLSKCTSIT